MSFKFIIALNCFLLWCGCATVDDAGRIYFKSGRHVKGVEPADAFLERMEKEKELRHLMYGQAKSMKIIQCTLLRNQLYVAALKSSAPKEVIESVKIMEAAYQENDDAFLEACNHILATHVGKLFINIQKQYMSRIMPKKS